jgi:hypothetical protein
MKKLLLILPIFLLTLAVNAQTEDEVYIGKGKTFGNYKGIIIPETDRNAKPIKTPTTITGMVVTVVWCEEDCLKMTVKKEDGTTVIIGTKDNGFTVPKKIVGRKIIVEGMDSGQISGGRKRKDLKKDAQQDIQFAATGIKVID